MKAQVYVLKNSLYVSRISNGSVIVIVKQATVGQDGFVQQATFSHTQCPKKMILNCQSLKSHWIHALTRGARANNHSVKKHQKASFVEQS